MKLLFVEDNQQLRSTVVDLLTHNDYEVSSAEDGEQGLEMALKNNYDLIISDINLPKLTGLEMLTRIRNQKSTPVILLTAKSDIDDRVAGLQAGADDYLTKPFAFKELQARIESVCRRYDAGDSVVISLGSLTIDTSKRSIMINDELVNCSAKEYSIIKLLAENAGKVISRSGIYDVVFPNEDSTSSNVLEVYIHKLRKNFGKQFILTKWGQGYTIGNT